jgi:transposase
LRLQAIERFEGRQKNAEIAVALRVSLRSVERWRRAWREQGEASVLSKGSPGRSKLSEAQVVRLEREIDYGTIDEFMWIAGEFALVGDWGRIQVNSHQTPWLEIEVVHGPQP